MNNDERILESNKTIAKFYKKVYLKAVRLSNYPKNDQEVYVVYRRTTLHIVDFSIKKSK